MTSEAVREKKKREWQTARNQQRLTYASAATALGAAGLRMTPAAARAATHVMERSPKHFPRRVRQRVSWAGSKQGQERLERASNTAGIGSLTVGGLSTLGWARKLEEDVKRKERAAERAGNLVKADQPSKRWQDHVSDDARRGHAYLQRGKRDKRTQAGITGGVAGLAGLSSWTAARTAHRLRSPAHLGVAGVAAVPAAYLAPGVKRQWQESNRWAEKAKKIEAKGRERAERAGRDFLVGKAGSVAAYRRGGARAGGLVMRNGRVYYRRGTVTRGGSV